MLLATAQMERGGASVRRTAGQDGAFFGSGYQVEDAGEALQSLCGIGGLGDCAERPARRESSECGGVEWVG